MRAKVTLTYPVVAVVLIWFFPCLGQETQSRSSHHQRANAGLVHSSSQAQPSLPDIVQRLTETQILSHQNGLRSYTVVREYELLSGKKPEPSSVTAEVNVLPSGAKGYTIRSTQGGSSGERIVRRVLDHEAEIAPEWRQRLLTEENYTFQLLGRESVDGHDCFVLGLTPRRDSRDLIRGRAWVDADNFNVRRVEGTPAKSPSWWVKHLDITLEFSQVLGMWMQTAFTARAEVRLFGAHVLMGRDVQIRTPETSGFVAQQRGDERLQKMRVPSGLNNSPAMIGSGVMSLPWRQKR